jgi:predicted RNase H-like nuclease
MVWLCGVDGFKSKWCAVLRRLDTHEFSTHVVLFQDLLNLPGKPKIIAVDLPIGLPEVTPSGGRTCEFLAREIVGPHRARSVFSSVGRRALVATTRVEADRLSRENGGIGVGAHAWGLAKKLREVDALMTPARQQVIREVHPELSFQEMVGRPSDYSKKTTAGKQERIAALIEQGFPDSFVRTVPNGLRVGQDDFLDACAALWTAERIYRGTAKRIPAVPERDVRGLDMAIWF